MGAGTAAARNASYSGPGPSPGTARTAQRGASLSKDLLASLDNYNKINDKKGPRVDRVADSIEAASHQRRSRGELKPIDQKKFKPTQAQIDEANNGMKDKENKPSNANAQVKPNAPRPPTNPQQQRKPPLKGPAQALQAAGNDKDKNFGKVPKYLQKYKEEAKEQEDANVEAKKQAEILRNQPPGTKLMPEAERIQTLAELEKNRKEVNALLAKMPISMQTQHMQR